MKKRLFILSGLLLAVCASARASVTFELEADLLATNASDNVGVPDGMTVVIVADTTAGTQHASDFAAPTPGAILPAPGTTGQSWGTLATNTVIWTEATDGNFNEGANGALDDISPGLNLASLTGDMLEMYWFPTEAYSGTTGSIIAPGDTFGSFTGSGWVVPADGTTAAQLTYFTPNGVTVEFPANSGTDVGTFGTVAGSPIPEPADFAALGGVLSLGLVALRRRKNVVA